MTVAGAGGVVFDDEGRVLLLGHRDGVWVFPKGHIDEGEDALTTALREIEEESGIRATIPDPDTSFTTSYVNARGEDRLITWFIGQVSEASFSQREAIFPDGGFFDPDEALRQLTFPEDRQLLERILRERG